MPGRSFSVFQVGRVVDFGERRGLVLVAEEALGGYKPGEYSAPGVGLRFLGYQPDWLVSRVDLGTDRAAQWLAAADIYQDALRSAERELYHAQARSWLYRRSWFRARAAARYCERLSAADEAYAPVRAAASQLVDEACDPHGSWRCARCKADVMQAWTFRRRKHTAHVRHQPGGMTAKALLAAIEQQPGITRIEWEPSAQAEAERVLGLGRFYDWWEPYDARWEQVLLERWDASNTRERARRQRRANKRTRKEPYRPSATSTSGSGGFGYGDVGHAGHGDAGHGSHGGFGIHI